MSDDQLALHSLNTAQSIISELCERFNDPGLITMALIEALISTIINSCATKELAKEVIQITQEALKVISDIQLERVYSNAPH